MTVQGDKSSDVEKNQGGIGAELEWSWTWALSVPIDRELCNHIKVDPGPFLDNNVYIFF